jgi:hypothetical protein
MPGVGKVLEEDRRLILVRFNYLIFDITDPIM